MKKLVQFVKCHVQQLSKSLIIYEWLIHYIFKRKKKRGFKLDF